MTFKRIIFNQLSNVPIETESLSPIKASQSAVAIYTERQVTPRELRTLIETLRRNFHLAKSNINSACEKLRKEIEKREEAGLHLVTLLTQLQEAELALADPLTPETADAAKSRKELDKLTGTCSNRSELSRLKLTVMDLSTRV